jgi:superfamily I DNA/RNA helicase
MSHKAARLLNKESGNLVAVTFTKDAAEELKSRIVKQSGDDKVNRIAAGTFHSLCISMCKKAGIKFDLINEQQRQFIFKKIGVYFSENYTAQEVQEIVDRLKCSMNGAFKSDHKEMLDLYQKELAHYGKSDFQDIIIRTVELLEQKKISPINCKWMLVDEAQDMDEWQLEWVLLHAKSGIHCTVVGDDDQAIYAFRGSLGYEGMMKFQRETRATVLTLPTNYRCHSEILMPAAMVIQNNLDRVEKSIKSEKGEGGRIIVESVERVEEEADYVVTVLNVSQIKDGKTGQWGLLARTNSIHEACKLNCLSAD